MQEDWKRPDFWVMAVVNIAAALVAILATRGVLSAEEGVLWVALVEALATPVALIVIGIVTRQYLAGQATVRQARVHAGLRD